MEKYPINFLECIPGQFDGGYVAGKNARICQIFLGSEGNYTDICEVPRRIGEAGLADVGRYCHDLAETAFMREITSPAFPMAIFGTIALYFFLRYLTRLGSVPQINLRDDPMKEPTKRDLRFPT